MSQNTNANNSHEPSSPLWVRILAAFEGALVVVAVVVAAGMWIGSVNQSEAGPGPSQAAHPDGGSGWQALDSYVFYVVGSEAEAADLRLVLEAGNNIRHGLGLDLMRERVLVATGQEHAARIVLALEEGNRILAAFHAEDRIVNLVG